jgi:3-isopropylmalate/(R)-2-methylmalate dehydratase small subunit
MQPFATLTAVAAPLDSVNIDTDQIFPTRFLHKPRGTGFAKQAFHDLRFNTDGSEIAAFPLNQEPYRNAKIIVAGSNFGCGSSREGAVYALFDFGIRSVIAPSFGDIHAANQLQNGMLPLALSEDICATLRRQLHDRPGALISIDLAAQTVTGPDGKCYDFTIVPSTKERLLAGTDEVGLVMAHIDAIERFEALYYVERPWLMPAQRQGA